jgi:hypothetical protein
MWREIEGGGDGDDGCVYDNGGGGEGRRDEMVINGPPGFGIDVAGGYELLLERCLSLVCSSRMK